MQVAWHRRTKSRRHGQRCAPGAKGASGKQETATVGSPDTPAAWTWLLGAGVDIINTDKLQALDAFLRARQ
ncbi:MAG: hypothetical protein HC859_05225 [Bacteroidia bacterium]|nr:hypothetical protein [Bacteroidia bacterium]